MVVIYNHFCIFLRFAYYFLSYYDGKEIQGDFVDSRTQLTGISQRKNYFLYIRAEKVWLFKRKGLHLQAIKREI